MGTIFEAWESNGERGVSIAESPEGKAYISVADCPQSCQSAVTDSQLRDMADTIYVHLADRYGKQQGLDYQLRILEACRKLRVDRAKEYNNGVSVDTYMAFGTKSYFTFIWTKILRLKSMISKPNNRYEGLLDSIYDGINYLLFFGAWILQQLDQGKEGDSVDICTILDESDLATREFVAKYLESSRRPNELR